MTDAEREELPPDLREFLVELSKALHQVGFYPPGHPSVEPVVDRLHRQLEELLRQRENLTLAVSPHALITEEGETDPEHSALRGLAERLHAHELARLVVLPVPEREEVAGFLATVSARPDAEEGPLGSRRDLDAAWPHLSLKPVEYDRLAMTGEGEAAEAPAVEGEGEAEELWMGLARAALADAFLEGVEEGLPDVPQMVIALERFSADEARARTAAVRMMEVARKLQQGGPDAAPKVRDRLEELLEEIDPEALGRIFGAAPPSLGRGFLEATAEWMPVNTVLEMVEHVSGRQEMNLSYHMLRLLSKLADLVQVEEKGRDPEAEKAFREQVQSLVGGWQRNIQAPDEDPERGNLPDPGPRRGAGGLETARQMVAPERLVEAALEVDTLGQVGERAVDEMVKAGKVSLLLERLRGAPPGEKARPAVWRRVGTAEGLRHVLTQDPPDFEALDDMLAQLGDRAAGLLLDALSEAGSRSVRRQIFSRLVEMEGEVEAEMLDRLEDDRWFVKRNMLALLTERGELPAGFSPLAYADHPHAAVRREAYRLALRHSEEREEAVRRGMRDEDPKVLSLAFGSLERLPSEALPGVAPAVADRVRDDDLSSELRRPGIRVLGRAGGRQALRALLSLCRTRKLWTFWTTSLADKSPLMLEALRALAGGWSDHPEARELLEEARASSDPEIREAAGDDTHAPEAA